MPLIISQINLLLISLSDMNHHYLKSHLAGTPPAQPAAANQASQLDQDWVLTAAIVLLLIQTGYALRAAGSVRYKNA